MAQLGPAPPRRAPPRRAFVSLHTLRQFTSPPEENSLERVGLILENHMHTELVEYQINANLQESENLHQMTDGCQ
ncbi:hypothetical protein EVAR_10776_1 [Eumeta japonica]|uniref:Uncharacterized protein n=1 Tax=Eumeta variegata TaxID=151549 RepID=A0A4C1W630_EUMVA|nr:hypothetical protein EVAR_10776_1 [Eumeta japonica]